MSLDPMMAMMMNGMIGNTGGGYSPQEAAQNPYGSSGGQGAMTRQLAPLRAMSYINRDSRSGMQMPRNAPNRNAQQNMPGVGDGQDYSQYTYDPEAHAAAAHFLGQYGLSPLDQSQVKQNTILPNSGFFGAHPRLSAMLEGGIYGAATSRGSNTIGEGITNVADSLIAGPRMRAAAFNQQFEKPFQAANMLEGMQDSAQRRTLTEAQIQHTRAATQALQDKPDPLPHITPMGRDVGGWVDNTTGKYTENPGYDPKEAARNTPGVATIERFARARGWDPATMNPQQWKQVNQDHEKEQVRIAGDRTGAETHARIKGSYAMGATVPADVKNQANETMKSWIDPKNKTIRSSIRQQQMMDPKNPRLLTEDEINGQITKHNQKVMEDTQRVYEGWKQTFNDQNPNTPIP